METDLLQIKNDDEIHRAAQQLRNDILNMPVTKMSENYTLEDLIKSKCEIPLSWRTFMSTLLCGTNVRREKSEYTQRSISSISQDMIFSVQKSLVKTSKHITPRSEKFDKQQKVINMINKFGHCCSYSVLERIETEATFTSMNANDLCSEDVRRVSNLSTGVAFNNFDRFVEIRVIIRVIMQ